MNTVVNTQQIDRNITRSVYIPCNNETHDFINEKNLFSNDEILPLSSFEWNGHIKTHLYYICRENEISLLEKITFYMTHLKNN